MVSRADRERLCTLDPVAAKRVKVMCSINQKKTKKKKKGVY